MLLSVGVSNPCILCPVTSTFSLISDWAKEALLAVFAAVWHRCILSFPNLD